MFGFMKQIFVEAMSFFNCNVSKSVSMNNEECKIRPDIINVSINELHFILTVLKQINTVAVDQMQVLLTISNLRIMINADENVNNR